MTATIALFDSRKDEIEFYYQVLHDVMSHKTKGDKTEHDDGDNSNADNFRSVIKTRDNNRFVRIMKSNFLVMLYNLIESCVKKGFEEIYEVLEAENIPYVQASYALRDIWSNYEISKAERSNAKDETYGKRVKNILERVISNAPVALSKKVIETMASGNLDALKIRELLRKHDISFTETNVGDKHRILTVKTKRNSLAHGDESFDEAARDLTLDDLKNIKSEVLIFIADAIKGIENYYSKQLYRLSPPT
jgi:hypothetical protein